MKVALKLSAMLSALLLLALAPPAHAVDEGVPDRDRHPNVGLIGFDPTATGRRPAAFLCTGVVISDRHFLTAEQCGADSAPTRSVVVSLQPGSPAAPVYRPGVFPDDFPFFADGPGDRWRGRDHPSRTSTMTARPHDVAVVTFPSGAFAGVTPVRLPEARLVDRLSRTAVLRLVGYGADPERGDGTPAFVARGLPSDRTTSARADHQSADRAEGRDSASATRGSPQFLGETNVVVSLFSDGGAASCPGPYLSQRLDTRSERRFLAGFVRLSRRPGRYAPALRERARLVQGGARALGLTEAGVCLSEAAECARHAAGILAMAEVGERLARHREGVGVALLGQPDAGEVDQRVAGVDRHPGATVAVAARGRAARLPRRGRPPPARGCRAAGRRTRCLPRCRRPSPPSAPARGRCARRPAGLSRAAPCPRRPSASASSSASSACSAAATATSAADRVSGEPWACGEQRAAVESARPQRSHRARPPPLRAQGVHVHRVRSRCGTRTSPSHAASASAVVGVAAVERPVQRGMEILVLEPAAG